MPRLDGPARALTDGARSATILRALQVMVTNEAPTLGEWVRFLRGVPFRCGVWAGAHVGLISPLLRVQFPAPLPFHQGEGMGDRHSPRTRESAGAIPATLTNWRSLGIVQMRPLFHGRSSRWTATAAVSKTDERSDAPCGFDPLTFRHFAHDKARITRLSVRWFRQGRERR